MARKASRARKKNDRFRLLLYARLIGRQRLPSLLLAIILLGLWYGVNFQSLGWPSAKLSDLLLTGGLLSLAFAGFSVLAPRQAYAQPRNDHLRIQSPIFRIKIRYEQIMNTKPIKVGRVFLPNSLSIGQRQFLSPFWGNTALAVDLRESPRFLPLLRLFFHRFMFNPESPGLILLVDDWIALSQLLSSRIDAWRMSDPAYMQGRVSDAAPIIESSKAEKKEKRFKFF